MFYELFVELRSVHIFTIYSSVGCSCSSLIYDIFVVMRSCCGLDLYSCINCIVHDIVLFCIHFVVLRDFRSSMKF